MRSVVFEYCTSTVQARDSWPKTKVKILDTVDCISHRINILGKGMNTTILLPAMGK